MKDNTTQAPQISVFLIDFVSWKLSLHFHRHVGSVTLEPGGPYTAIGLPALLDYFISSCKKNKRGGGKNKQLAV